MKKLTALFLLMVLALSGCGTTGGTPAAPSESGIQSSSTAPSESAVPTQFEPPASAPAESGGAGGTLVVYYSSTNNTERVAGYIADALGADTFRLVPVEPYTSDNLNWTDRDSRVSKEHDDESLRNMELEADTVENWADYDTIFIGYPIWWGIAAWPVNSFIQNNDFTGKTVIPFCTSASSGLGQSGELLAEMAGTGDWQEGIRFRSGVAQEDVTAWVQGLGVIAEK